MTNLLYKILKHLPFVRIYDSKPFTPQEATDALTRIIEEKRNQWDYNHPNEEFLGVEEFELFEELERRMRQT